MVIIILKKDYRYKIHPTENNNLRLPDRPNFLRIHYQVQNNTQIRKNQKVIKNDIDEFIVKSYPIKKQQTQQQQQPNFKPPNCPGCKRNNWLGLDKGYNCKSFEYIINKQKDQIDNKVLGHYHYFSTRIPIGIKIIREIY